MKFDDETIGQQTVKAGGVEVTGGVRIRFYGVGPTPVKPGTYLTHYPSGTNGHGRTRQHRKSFEARRQNTARTRAGEYASFS